jgi:hypothetical protein
MIALLLLAAAINCPEPKSSELVGLWESASTSQGGIGHTIEFRPDGTIIEAATVIVDLHYRIVGDRLSVGAEPLPLEPDPTGATTLRFEGARLLATAPDGTVVERERLGQAIAGQPAIVGVWRYRHSTGGIAFERYTPDGRVRFRLPMKSSSGCYVPAAKRVTLTMSRKETETRLQFELRGDELTLTGQGRTSRYLRDEAGPWYDRKHLDYKPPQ